MKTMASALLALSVLAGFAATASSAPFEESVWPYLDRDNRGGKASKTAQQQHAPGSAGRVCYAAFLRLASRRASTSATVASMVGCARPFCLAISCTNLSARSI